MLTPEHLPQRPLLQATRILAVAIINLLLHAPACHSNLVSIDHNYKIATLLLRRKRSLMFTSQNLRDLRCQAAQYLTFSIDDIPLWFQISSLGAICLHHYPFSKQNAYLRFVVLFKPQIFTILNPHHAYPLRWTPQPLLHLS